VSSLARFVVRQLRNCFSESGGWPTSRESIPHNFSFCHAEQLGIANVFNELNIIALLFS
jgi:hypothetical protein